MTKRTVKKRWVAMRLVPLHVGDEVRMLRMRRHSKETPGQMRHKLLQEMKRAASNENRHAPRHDAQDRAAEAQASRRGEYRASEEAEETDGEEAA
jgi:hypothetical protein